VGVEGAFGETDLFHNVIDGCSVITVANKEFEGRSNDPLFCFFASFHGTLKRY
jgi:hypothetical protein